MVGLLLTENWQTCEKEFVIAVLQLIYLRFVWNVFDMERKKINLLKSTHLGEKTGWDIVKKYFFTN